MMEKTSRRGTLLPFIEADIYAARKTEKKIDRQKERMEDRMQDGKNNMDGQMEK